MMDQFLNGSVFYPCSGLDGAPIKYVGKTFQRFFYADYFTRKSDFFWDCQAGGCRGYTTSSVEELDVRTALGCSWEEIAQESPETIRELPFKWHPENAFLALARFEREPSYSDDHGPERFELLFAQCEAIALFRATYGRYGVVPGCLAHIRPGLSFGGNFRGYTEQLDRAMRQNRAGLPEFLLYDHLGADPGSGGYLPMASRYRKIQHWARYHPDFGSGGLYLARDRWRQRELAADWASAGDGEDLRKRESEGL
jgi:hypothetical protein